MPPRWGLKPIVRPSFSHGWLAVGHRMAPASRASDFLTPPCPAKNVRHAQSPGEGKAVFLRARGCARSGGLARGERSPAVYCGSSKAAESQEGRIGEVGDVNLGAEIALRQPAEWILPGSQLQQLSCRIDFLSPNGAT